jgi:hypothetical protein
VTNIPSHEVEGAPGSLGTIANLSFEDVAIESENGVLYVEHSLEMALIRLDFWLAWFAPTWLAWFAPMWLAWFAPIWLAWFAPSWLAWFAPIWLAWFATMWLAWFAPMWRVR